ncbi:hypothetical protein B296_00052382 [Ensete ventricosum]|uniref:Uncharacterized protein n=1 Tax=Ensete ventricosum TaxID=4639 RepID=A0A426X2T1_ENSVE|nr:hypothetical protein B296_00052382 [Ensete ventricosum]
MTDTSASSPSVASQAFWGRDGVTSPISTVVVDQVVHPDPTIRPGLSRVELLERGSLPPVGRRGGAAAAEAASWSSARRLDVEILVVGAERRFAPIDLLEAAPRRPVVAVPQRRVDPHGLRAGVRHPPCLVVLVHSDGNAIDEKAAPRESSGWVVDASCQDGVGVEICGWIKPQVHPLLSVSLPVRVHVGLNGVRLPRPVPQELEIYLISIDAKPKRRGKWNKIHTGGSIEEELYRGATAGLAMDGGSRESRGKRAKTAARKKAASAMAVPVELGLAETEWCVVHVLIAGRVQPVNVMVSAVACPAAAAAAAVECGWDRQCFPSAANSFPPTQMTTSPWPVISHFHDFLTSFLCLLYTAARKRELVQLLPNESKALK